jgi:hypothetical protein
MTDFDDLKDRVIRLEQQVARLAMRQSLSEERVDQAIEAPPYTRNVVPPNVIGAAAALGEELAESRKIARSAKESARNLRRVVSPEDDTARHQVDEPFKTRK